MIIYLLNQQKFKKKFDKTNKTFLTYKFNSEHMSKKKKSVEGEEISYILGCIKRESSEARSIQSCMQPPYRPLYR